MLINSFISQDLMTSKFNPFKLRRMKEKLWDKKNPTFKQKNKPNLFNMPPIHKACILLPKIFKNMLEKMKMTYFPLFKG